MSRKKALAVGTGAVIAGGTGYAIYSSHKGSGSSSSSSSKPSESGSTPTDTGEETGEETTTGDGESTGSTLKSRVTEVPIDNYEDAMAFANREWNKIKRDNGHTLECQVQGSCEWKVGEWCKVYMPSFDIDDFMYIIRVSQSSDGGEWSTNLSLMDYPPGWGKEELQSDSEDEDSTTEDGAVDGDGTSEDGTTGDGTSEDGTTTGDGSENSNMRQVDTMNLYYPEE